jgi:carboxyl-terminal processing protease
MLAVLAIWSLSASAANAKVDAPEELAPVARHEKIGQLVTEFIQKSHYSHAAVDDELSSLVLDRYIEALDNNRMYLLASDIAAFEKNRFLLDDMVRAAPLVPVFDMFEIYRTRVRQRLEFALSMLETEPDFSVDEEYIFDRSELPWAETEEQLDELWTKRVKNDALGLALADKTWEETQDVLEKRYSRFLKRMDQVKSDDVFETFMNAFAHTLDPHSSYLSPRNSEEYRIQPVLFRHRRVAANRRRLRTRHQYHCRRPCCNRRSAAAQGPDYSRRPGCRWGIGRCGWLAAR